MLRCTGRLRRRNCAATEWHRRVLSHARSYKSSTKSTISRKRTVLRLDSGSYSIQNLITVGVGRGWPVDSATLTKALAKRELVI